jgi:hypothetical protein
MPDGWSPARILSDFEAPALAAAQHCFPNATRTGCLFHLGQSIYRRIQRNPILRVPYENGGEPKWKLKSLQALAFVPLESVYKYFCRLVATWEDFGDEAGFGEF